MDHKDRNPGEERWVDEITVSGADHPKAEALRRALFRALPDVFQVNDLPKTAFEKTAIAETVAAVNQMLLGLYLGGSPVSEARFHVLDGAEFVAKFGRNVAGKSEYSHVYLKRQADPVGFFHNLTHETAHLASFLSLKISLLERDGGHELSIDPKRSGLALYGLRDGPGDPLFNGLNEGVTEIVAHDIRTAIAGAAKLLDAEQGRRLTKTWVYLPQVKLVWHLMGQVAGRDSEADLRREVYGDYFTGTSRFLNRLYAADPDLVRTLRDMGSGASAAFAAADRLACPEIMDDIRRFYAPKPPDPPR